MILSSPRIDLESVAQILTPRLPIYRYRAPRYQTTMLASLRAVWAGPVDRLLDVGGGTGVIAECMARLLPARQVTAMDVVDRFCTGLSVETAVYDGTSLPFAAGHFEAATLNNVVHHIPIPARVTLFRDIARVVSGPLYIKDHEPRTALDHRRLAVLDLLGNAPFSGMIAADYLSMRDWEALARESGWHIAEIRRDVYRRGPMTMLFPNRLELTMRWERD